MRILVTGSREWRDVDAIGLAIFQARFEAPWPSQPVIVHGDCPTGADAIANGLALRFSWEIEPHPANWDKYGKTAGPIRNQEMVDAGADICLAFFQPGAANRGTADCVSRAEKAGIPVIRYPLEG